VYAASVLDRRLISSSTKQNNSTTTFSFGRNILLIEYSKPTGPGHVAFEASSRRQVHEFYTAALKAGASPYLSPGEHDAPADCFSASVTDLDENVIEVVFHSADHDNRTLVSNNNNNNRALSVAPTNNPISDGNVLSSIQRSCTDSATSAIPMFGGIGISPTTIAGTLLGAAAGAAAAYAFCKSEEDSRMRELEASMAAHRLSGRSPSQRHRVPSEQRLLSGHHQPMPLERRYTAPTESRRQSNRGRIDRGFSVVEVEEEEEGYEQPERRLLTGPRSTFSQRSRRTAVRAIEAPPDRDDRSYVTRSASYRTALEEMPSPTEISMRRSEVSTRRSEASVRRSEAPGHRSEVSVRSKRSSRSEKSRTVRGSEVDEAEDRSYDQHKHPIDYGVARSTASSKKSSKGSRVSRRSKRESRISSHSEEYLPALPDEFDDDLDTIAPSDSVSNAGSRRSRSRRSSDTAGKTRSDYWDRYDRETRSDVYIRKPSSEPGHKKKEKDRPRSRFSVSGKPFESIWE
jgi:hypothetical protein